MKSNIIYLLFILLLVAGTTQMRADDNGGSGYSRYGLGDLRYNSTARAMGMGGTSIALLSSTTIDPFNPASWTNINHTRFSVNAMYEGFSTSDGHSSSYLSSMNFTGAMLAIPLISKWGVIFSTGIAPFSRINYNVTLPASQSGFDYTLQYIGRGGVSLAHVGFSAMPTSDIHLGVKLNYYFGTPEYTLKQTFVSQYTNAEMTRSTRVNGIGFTYGAIYSGLGKMFNLPESNTLNIGFIATTTSYLTASDERYYSYTTSFTTRDTLVGPETKIRIPYALGGGIAYSSDRFVVAGDYYYQKWSNFTLDGAASPDLRDSYRISIGGEITPKRELSSPFFQHLSYRLGFFYNASYYIVHGQPINEVGPTAGIGIPIFGDTRLNIGAEYGFRGTTDYQLQKDKILRISMTLSVGELWFMKTQEE
jgi:hypothetical protein